MSDPAEKTRWYRLTPDRLAIGLLVLECLLWLSERFQWPMWHKGYAVLIAVAVVVATMLLTSLWLVLSLFFRWHFQFGIRSLLILTFAVALPFSWLSWEMEKARKQREAVEAIERSGCVAYDYQLDLSGTLPPSRRGFWPNRQPPGPGWLRSLLGDDFYGTVVWATLRPIKATDADVVHVKGLNTLRELDINFTKVTDVALGHLKGLTQLQHLNLSQTRITDNGLANLAGLNQLQSLDLTLTQEVTDAGIEHLKGLNQLQELSLYGIDITDGGIEHLSGLKRLEYLELRATKVTDEGVKKLQQELPNCTIYH